MQRYMLKISSVKNDCGMLRGCSQTCELAVIVFASGDPCSEDGQETADDTVPLPQPGAKLYKRRNSLKLKKLPNILPVKGLKLISPRFISERN